MEKMKVLGEDFDSLDNEIKPLLAKLEALLKDVDAMIEAEKGKNVKAADEAMAELDKKLADMDALKTAALKKLVEYNKLMDEVKETEAKDDPALLETLAQLAEEAKAIEEEIHGLEGSMAALQEQRNEIKASVDDAYSNPETFTPKQLDDIRAKLGDANAKADVLLEKDHEINDDLDKRIEDLKNLRTNSSTQGSLSAQAKDLNKQIADFLAKTKGLLSTLPAEIEDMLAALNEMKNDTEPDKNIADYFEKKKQIEQQIKILLAQKAKLAEVQEQFPTVEKATAQFQGKSQSAKDIEPLKELI